MKYGVHNSTEFNGKLNITKKISIQILNRLCIGIKSFVCLLIHDRNMCFIHEIIFSFFFHFCPVFERNFRFNQYADLGKCVWLDVRKLQNATNATLWYYVYIIVIQMQFAVIFDFDKCIRSIQIRAHTHTNPINL